jgi:hypothetical protein
MIKLKHLLLEIAGTEHGIYYHITFGKYIKNIKKHGIKKREKGEWTGMFNQDIRQKKGIFVFENYYDALTWAFKSAWDKKTEKIYILKINTWDTDFEEDTHWEAQGGLGKWLVKHSNIEPENIVEYIPFDISKWTPEMTKTVNDLKAANRK